MTLTCGHKVDDIRHTFRIRARSQDYDPITHMLVPAVLYGVFCPKCTEEFEESGVVIKSDEEEQKWLASIDTEGNDESRIYRTQWLRSNCGKCCKSVLQQDEDGDEYE